MFFNIFYHLYKKHLFYKLKFIVLYIRYAYIVRRGVASLVNGNFLKKEKIISKKLTCKNKSLRASLMRNVTKSNLYYLTYI